MDIRPPRLFDSAARFNRNFGWVPGRTGLGREDPQAQAEDLVASIERKGLWRNDGT